MSRKIPDASPLTGAETAIVIQDGKAVKTTTQDIANKGPTTQGAKGDTGPQGPAGSKGDIGPQGLKGDIGSQGPTGLKGDTGSQGAAGATGAKGDTGSQGAKGDTGATGATGPAGSPKRVERFISAATNASGIALVTFSPAFEAVPDIDVIDGWATEQMITGAVVAGSATKTGCQVQVMVSRGTLLLTSGPFQKAAAGVTVTVRAIGN